MSVNPADRVRAALADARAAGGGLWHARMTADDVEALLEERDALRRALGGDVDVDPDELDPLSERALESACTAFRASVRALRQDAPTPATLGVVIVIAVDNAAPDADGNDGAAHYPAGYSRPLSEWERLGVIEAHRLRTRDDDDD